MKLFIWKDVLHDYKSGMAVAYAEDLETALKAFPEYVAERLGAPTEVIDCDKSKDTVVEYVYGGG